MNRHRDTSDRSALEGLVRRARAELRDWTDTPGGDPGVALVELFALVGDLLTSHSETVAAEAHLAGGRRRAAARRGDLEVEVDGRRWHQVTDLVDSAPEDQHFVVTRRDDGASVIEFGDGVHGQLPPPGSSIRASYRGSGTYSSVLLQQGRVILDTDWSDASRAACGVHRATVLDDTDPLVQRRLFVRVQDVNGGEALWAAACLPASGAEEVPAIGDGVWVAFEAGDPNRPVWLGRRTTD